MICIQNRGEIELGSLFLIGASTKRGDNTKIGLFGSGNKYAIATLLRKNIPFRIFSGMNEVKISVETEQFREQSFDVIYINGEKTSLTTDMGPDWETWFCLREFVSNAMDEGEHFICDNIEIEPEENTTKIYIEETQEINEILSNIKEYFCFNEIPHEIIHDERYGNVSVFEHDADGLVFYRKGIRCNEQNDDRSYFRYNFEDIEINESRIIKHAYKADEKVGMFILKTENKEIIEKYINNYRDYEDFRNADFDITTSASGTWRDVIGNRKLLSESINKVFSLPAEDRIKAVLLPDKLVQRLKSTFPELLSYGDSRAPYFETEASTEQIEMIETSVLNLWELDIPINEHQIKIAIFQDKDIMGCYSDNNIVLSVDYLKDQREIELILLEEYIHSLGYNHGTRIFDDFLIKCVHELLRKEKPKGLCKGVKNV